MVSPSEIHLVLFLSRSTPLRRWHKKGIFSREIAIYKALAQEIGKVSIVTSGGADELDFQTDLGKIEIIYNRWRLPANVFSLLAPFLHGKRLSQATIFKTNQLDGAWTAIIAGKLYRKPVILRAGYLWSKNYHRTNPGLRSALIKRIEAICVNNSSALIVTTDAIKRFFNHANAINRDRIFVIPNYVDIELFTVQKEIPKIPGRICFIGRLSPEKNLYLLIQAIASIRGISLEIIGEGSQYDELSRIAESEKADVSFTGSVFHAELYKKINQAEIFILPSKFEGHPKALIEAMACGAAVIGTDVEGIQDIIIHRQTGLLCKPTVESIRTAILELYSTPELRQQLGRNARQFAVENFDLLQITSKEIETYRVVISRYEH